MAGRASLTPNAADLERWIEQFRGPLVGLLASWGRDWRAAEELAQDCFAQAWLSRERFVGNPNSLLAVGAWLRGIAFRLHAAGQRREAARPAESLENEPAAPVSEQDERREVLARAFAKLTAPQQTVLRMHYLEESSAAEVAALLGLSAKAVEGRLYQARRALREIVERESAREARGVRA
jgi:RNA polymerase sigma-70 factor (ECF subfamily)